MAANNDSLNISDTRNCTLDVLNDYCEPLEDYVSRIEELLSIDAAKAFLILLYIVVFVVGAVGNILVCVAVLRNKEMRTVTNVFLVNLAVGDFLVIVICMPSTIVEDIRETWYLGTLLCKIIKYLQHVSIIVSVLTLTVISIERWYAICYPFKFRATMKRAVWFIVLIWMFALSLGLAQAIDMEAKHYKKLPQHIDILTECSNTWNSHIVLTMKYVEMGILFVMPFLWMVVAYGMISHKLWMASPPGQHASSQRSSHDGLRSPAENQLRGRRRAALMLIAVVVIFFICYLPVHLIRIVRTLAPTYYFNDAQFVAMFKNIGLYSHWLCYFNSAINPVIYNFMSAKFRTAFREACRCSTIPVNGYNCHGGACYNSYAMRNTTLNRKSSEMQVNLIERKQNDIN